jgi:predicted ArsR family transcriptional regulator
MAVRLHLYELAEESLVEETAKPKGRGRPTKIWSLTPAAAEDGDDWLLIENHCPICSAATACQRLCANELDVFQQALGPDTEVTRESHLLAGARRCVYRIRQRA